MDFETVYTAMSKEAGFLGDTWNFLKENNPYSQARKAVGYGIESMKAQRYNMMHAPGILTGKTKPMLTTQEQKIMDAIRKLIGGIKTKFTAEDIPGDINTKTAAAAFGAIPAIGNALSPAPAPATIAKPQQQAATAQNQQQQAQNQSGEQAPQADTNTIADLTASLNKITDVAKNSIQPAQQAQQDPQAQATEQAVGAVQKAASMTYTGIMDTINGICKEAGYFSNAKNVYNNIVDDQAQQMYNLWLAGQQMKNKTVDAFSPANGPYAPMDRSPADMKRALNAQDLNDFKAPLKSYVNGTKALWSGDLKGAWNGYKNYLGGALGNYGTVLGRVGNGVANAVGNAVKSRIP